jgi:hypothetical protein
MAKRSPLGSTATVNAPAAVLPALATHAINDAYGWQVLLLAYAPALSTTRSGPISLVGEGVGSGCSTGHWSARTSAAAAKIASDAAGGAMARRPPPSSKESTVTTQQSSCQAIAREPPSVGCLKPRSQ